MKERRGIETNPPQFRVTEDQRTRMANHLESFRHVVDPDFKLPSRHALTRYLTSYFQGFHLHMPFIHQQTWRLLDTPLEVFFAIVTMGAQYCFEHRNSERLFQVGKAILLERLKQETSKFGPKTNTFLSMHNYLGSSMNDVSMSINNGSSQDSRLWEPMDTIRALIILMGYATWYVIYNILLLLEPSSQISRFPDSALVNSTDWFPLPTSCLYWRNC